MAKAFKKAGHQVTVFSPSLGLIATKLEAADIRCINKVTKENGLAPFNFVLEQDVDKFDIIISNHFEITNALREAYPETPIISTIHGILHRDDKTGEVWPEHPSISAKVSQFVAVSEEVQSLLKEVYNLESKVIRNPIDLERFKKKKFKEKPESFLVNTNYWGVDSPINKAIKEVANHFGAKLMAIGENFVPTYEVEEVLNDVDVVFGMGRGLLEGMSRGCLAVSHGRWGSGGVLTPKTYEEIKECNFSGRNAKGLMLLPQELITRIQDAYNQANIDGMRKIIEENHDADKVAAEYLKIAKELV